MIPCPVCDRLGLKPGQKLTVIEYAGCVELIPQRDIGKLKGTVMGIDKSFVRENDRA